MTRERLQSIPLEELQSLARKEGLDTSECGDHAALVELILESYEEGRRDRSEQNNSSVRVEETKFEVSEDEELELSDEDACPIPHRYNESRIVLMVRDPRWAFAYWDLEDQKAASVHQREDFEQLVVRVYDVEGVEFNGLNAHSFFDIPVQFTDSNWYIYLPKEDRSYLLELGYIAAGRYHCLIRSNQVRTPRSTFSEQRDGECSGEEALLCQLEELGALKGFSSGQLIPQRISAVGRG